MPAGERGARRIFGCFVARAQGPPSAGIRAICSAIRGRVRSADSVGETGVPHGGDLGPILFVIFGCTF